MKSLSFFLLTGVFAILVATPVHSQQRKLPGAGTSPIKVGSDLADVTVFDQEGNEFSVRDKLKGKHAVLVFGCLT